jgi:hypothetical protein
VFRGHPGLLYRNKRTKRSDCPALKAAVLSTVWAMVRCRASRLAQATWGVMMRLTSRGLRRGLPFLGGLALSSSTAAPARQPLLGAAARAFSSTRPPRAAYFRCLSTGRSWEAALSPLACFGFEW